MRALISRLIAFALIAEAMFGALRLSSLLPQISFYDPVAIALILARGLLGALQFTGGWLLATHRPAGRAIARAALIAGAVLTFLDVGLDLAPTGIYHWYRWHATGAYAIYAATGVGVLRTDGSMNK